jgi:FdhD protein
MTTTMRTPGHDYELAAGWCWAEGLLDGRTVREIRYCATGSAVDTGFNVVTVQTDGPPVDVAPRLTTASSSCGICGSTSVDDLVERLCPLPAPTSSFDVDVLASLGEAVRNSQELFEATGGSHAAAACTPVGEPLVVREDIGRHNAVDKVVGRLLLDGGLPATGLVLWVSGRASFEMVQKAWAAGVAALVAVSAPSAAYSHAELRLAVAAAISSGSMLVPAMAASSRASRDAAAMVALGGGMVSAGRVSGCLRQRRVHGEYGLLLRAMHGPRSVSKQLFFLSLSVSLLSFWLAASTAQDLLHHAIQGPLDRLGSRLASLALARLAWGAAAGWHRTPEQAVREQRSMQLGSMLVDAPAHHPLHILRRHLANELAAVLAKV